MNALRDKWLKGAVLLFRFFLGGLFLYAGTTKVLDPEGFALSIYHYQLLPDLLINPAAIIVPWIEAVCGVALICRWWIDGASLIITGLLFVFLTALTVTLARGLDISCGCFSSTGEGNVSWLYLLRDFSLFVMGTVIFLFHDRESGRPASPFLSNS